MRRYCYALLKIELAGGDHIHTLGDVKVYLDAFLEKNDGNIELDYVAESFNPAPPNYVSDENLEDSKLMREIEIESWKEFRDDHRS